jgi:hypothetical protein
MGTCCAYPTDGHSPASATMPCCGSWAIAVCARRSSVASGPRTCGGRDRMLGIPAVRAREGRPGPGGTGPGARQGGDRRLVESAPARAGSRSAIGTRCLSGSAGTLTRSPSRFRVRRWIGSSGVVPWLLAFRIGSLIRTRCVRTGRRTAWRPVTSPRERNAPSGVSAVAAMSSLRSPRSFDELDDRVRTLFELLDRFRTADARR